MTGRKVRCKCPFHHTQLTSTKPIVSEYSDMPQSGSLSYKLSAVTPQVVAWLARLWFDLIYVSVPGHTAGVNGKWFNVTSSAAAPTTWSLGSDSLATVTTTLSSSSPTATPSTSASPSSAPAHSSGLGDGAIAGLAVGVAVLVAVLAFAVFWAVRSRRRLKALERNQQENVGVPELKYELGAEQEGQARKKSRLDASSGLAPDRLWVGEPWAEVDAMPARWAELGG